MLRYRDFFPLAGDTKASDESASTGSVTGVARGQAVGLVLDHGVTFAAEGLKPRPVNHGDMAAMVFDDPQVLQFASCFGNTLTANTQHVGDEFLGHRQMVVRKAIKG